MKIVRYSIDRKTAYGILKDNRIERIAGTPYRGIKGTKEYRKRSEVKLLAPCLPSKVIAIGLNYYSHAKEVKMEVPKEPLMFYKPSTSVIGPDEKIVRPRGCERLDYE